MTHFFPNVPAGTSPLSFAVQETLKRPTLKQSPQAIEASRGAGLFTTSFPGQKMSPGNARRNAALQGSFEGRSEMIVASELAEPVEGSRHLEKVVSKIFDCMCEKAVIDKMGDLTRLLDLRRSSDFDLLSKSDGIVRLHMKGSTPKLKAFTRNGFGFRFSTTQKRYEKEVLAANRILGVAERGCLRASEAPQRLEERIKETLEQIALQSENAKLTDGLRETVKAVLAVKDNIRQLETTLRPYRPHNQTNNVLAPVNEIYALHHDFEHGFINKRDFELSRSKLSALFNGALKNPRIKSLFTAEPSTIKSNFPTKDVPQSQIGRSRVLQAYESTRPASAMKGRAMAHQG